VTTFGEEELRGESEIEQKEATIESQGKELRSLFLLRVVIKFFLTSGESESENKFLDLD